jgi:hypothetical protein
MSHTTPGEDLAADPAFTGAARFLEGRIPPGLRVVAPDIFAPLLGTLSAPDAEPLPDWAVVATGGAQPLPLLRRLLAETTAVYANDGYIVFARRPTFGLADMRNAGPVRALAERVRTAGAETPATPPAPQPGPTFLEASVPKADHPPEAAMSPVTPPRAPDIPRAALPPEAMALQIPRPPGMEAAPAPAAPRPVPLPLPAAAPPRLAPSTAPRLAPAPVTAPAVPPEPDAHPAPAPEPRTAGWGTLPARVLGLLGPAAGQRVAGFGSAAPGLAAAAFASSALFADGSEPLPASSQDLALLLPGTASLASDLAAAAQALRPGGLALVVAENQESLGRRLAAALGRPGVAPGLTAAAIRGAIQAAGLLPQRLEGHSLDPWRATADTAPPGLDSADPAAALLEEAGEAAGPRHAAWLLFLARKG